MRYTILTLMFSGFYYLLLVYLNWDFTFIMEMGEWGWHGRGIFLIGFLFCVCIPVRCYYETDQEKLKKKKK